MNLPSLLSQQGVLEKGRLADVEAELQKPGASEEEVLQKFGITLEQILAAKGTYYGVPTRAIGEKALPFDVL